MDWSKGLVVSALAFYSDGRSLNPAEACSFFCRNDVWKGNKINKKKFFKNRKTHFVRGRITASVDFLFNWFGFNRFNEYICWYFVRGSITASVDLLFNWFGFNRFSEYICWWFQHNDRTKKPQKVTKTFKILLNRQKFAKLVTLKQLQRVLVPISVHHR